MRRFAGKSILPLLLAAGLVVLYHSDRKLFRRPEILVDRAAGRVGRALADRHGLFMLLDFGLSPPMEWIERAPVNQSGVGLATGPLGPARRFDGHQRTVIETQREWQDVGSRFSITLWVKLDDASPHQDILFTSAHRGRVGLRLDHGRMTFHIPPWNQKICYPFEDYGKFVHLAAVADADAGQAFLYQDGVLQAAAKIDKVEPPNHNIEVGKTRWYAVRDPLMGIINEVAVWKRALPEAEIGRLAGRPRRLARQLTPWRERSYHMFLGGQRALRGGLKTIDHFNPFLRPTLANDPALPELFLHFSGGDHRHFQQAHMQSCRLGVRPREAAAARRVGYVFAGRAGRAELRLHAPAAGYSDLSRHSFEMTLPPEAEPILGSRRLLLAPPEKVDFLLPLLETSLAREWGVSHTANGLLRLNINGVFHGLYYAEDFDRLGRFPGAAGDFFYGPTHPYDWPSLFRTGGPATWRYRSSLHQRLPLTGEELVARFDRLALKYQPLLRHDTTSRLSSREIGYRINRARNRLREHWPVAAPEPDLLRRTAESLEAAMLLGDNPSPFFLVSDLALPTSFPGGIRIEWRSSKPAILSPEGKLRRPDGPAPREVTLYALLSHGRQEIEKPLSFRVMPDPLAMPAVMLYVQGQLHKVSRLDGILHYYPAGSDGREPLILPARQESGGGIAHRGGTSYWESKKPFSVRLDSAHHLLDDTPTRHLYFIPGYTDATLMRNILSYDLFRAFSRPGAPRHAPKATWTEVFAFGRYHGIYEMGTRVQRRMLGYPPYRPENENNAEIYKILDFNLGFRSQVPGAIVQKLPQRRWGYHAEPYFDLMRKLAAAREESANAIGEWIDLDNAVDFHLFLNFTIGVDAMNVNYYLVRGPEPDALYQFVPFDCDKTFGIRATPGRWYRNLMIRELKAAPGFTPRLLARWRELRSGAACPRRLLGQVDEMETRLAPYIGWEHALWGYNRGEPFSGLVEALRGHIRDRYRFLDGELQRREEEAASKDASQAQVLSFGGNPPPLVDGGVAR